MPVFAPQPYPLFAIPLNPADDPPRFELTFTPVRLVVGWVTTDDKVLPAFGSGDLGEMVWDGPVLYEETRERAEQTAKNVDRAERVSVRDARMIALFERWDAWAGRLGQRVEQVSQRVEQHLDRIVPSQPVDPPTPPTAR